MIVADLTKTLNFSVHNINLHTFFITPNGSANIKQHTYTYSRREFNTVYRNREGIVQPLTLLFRKVVEGTEYLGIGNRQM